METHTYIEFEPGVKHDPELEKAICRCCFSSKKRLLEAKKFAQYFLDLAGLDVTKCDSLPPWICHECATLLRKAVKFKLKVQRAHSELTDCVTTCSPFPADREVSVAGSPHLSATRTLTWQVDLLTEHQGFLSVLQHTKQDHGQQNMMLKEASMAVGQDVKIEYNPTSDFDEDELPLGDYRSLASQIIEDILSPATIKTEPEDKKKKKKEIKSKKRKQKYEKKDLVIEEYIAPAKSIRKPVYIDPDKIKTIILSPEEQMKHREELRAANKFSYQCTLCYKGFNFDSKLQNHMHKHSPARGEFTCALCSMYFPSSYSAAVHAAAHSTRYQCRVCARQMTDRLSIYNHYRSQHEGITTVITCTICGKISSNDKTHRGHMRNHHSGVRPTCDVCGKSFVNKDSLTEHLQIHSGVKNYECGECGKRCRTRTQVKQHQLMHGDTRDFYCVECDARFKTAHTFRQHLVKSLKHRDEDSLKYRCSVCPKRFVSSARLRTHVSVAHEGARPHACAECGAGLATRAALRKHVAAVHRGLKPEPKHICDACGRAFRSKSVLTNHLRTHTGEKPYSCAECARAFTQRTAMHTHMRRVHRKEVAPPALPKREPSAEAEACNKERLAVYSIPKLAPWHPPDELFYVPPAPKGSRDDLPFYVTAGP